MRALSERHFPKQRLWKSLAMSTWTKLICYRCQILCDDDLPCPPNFFRSRTGACITCSVHEPYDTKMRNCSACPENHISQGGLSLKCEPCGPRMIASAETRSYKRCVCREGWGFKRGSGGTKCEKCTLGIANVVTNACIFVFRRSCEQYFNQMKRVVIFLFVCLFPRNYYKR